LVLPAFTGIDRAGFSYAAGSGTQPTVSIEMRRGEWGLEEGIVLITMFS
jgi:hypothetical protein